MIREKFGLSRNHTAVYFLSIRGLKKVEMDYG